MGHQCRLAQPCRCPRDTQALLEQGQGGTGRRGHQGGEQPPAAGPGRSSVHLPPGNAGSI